MPSESAARGHEQTSEPGERRDHPSPAGQVRSATSRPASADGHSAANTPARQAFKDCVRLRELAGRQTLRLGDNADLDRIADRLHALAAMHDKGVEDLAEAKRRLHLILSTIYSTHGYLVDGEIDTAAKLRAIERLARLDWDNEGVSDVV